MYQSHTDNNKLIIRFSSDLAAADRVVLESQDFFGRFAQGNQSDVKTVLRELLINAVEHGNRGNPDKQVECVVEYLGGERFKLEVKDEGEGFDPFQLKVDMDDPLQTRKRGYSLINQLADVVEFEDHGSRVTAFVSITRETGVDVLDEAGWKVLVPTGNLTASSAENLRKILVDLFEMDFKKFRFDLKYVEDMDSMALGVMAGFGKMMEEKTGDKALVVSNANRDLVNLFRMTRLEKVYRMEGLDEPHPIDIL
ncbi:MAG: ATP-binding protein [Deltaproteobacteria bacterium]|nr:ATP-binding protein [Deltaproteobacteria bacterium]